MWATRTRRATHSFTPEAWILLTCDCSQTRRDIDVARHLRRLSVLAIFAPAKLTSLLQLCGVCVLKELKTRIRLQKTSIRCRDSAGRLRAGDWISSGGTAIRDVIVDRCWEDAFDPLGLGASINAVDGRVRRTVPPALVQPRLPTRAEFGRMVSGSSHTEGLGELRASVVGHFMSANRWPPDAGFEQAPSHLSECRTREEPIPDHRRCGHGFGAGQELRSGTFCR